MRLSLITDATVEPVTLAEMKTYMKVDLSNEDDLITEMIVSARQDLEEWAGIGMTTKIFDMYIDELPDVIQIPFPPCQSVDAFVYNDADYSETTVPSTAYETFVYNGLNKSEIVQKPDTAYPTLLVEKNAIRIRFTNGYGDSASDVPNSLKTAIKITVHYWYENRDEQAIPSDALRIMRRYKKYNL